MEKPVIETQHLTKVYGKGEGAFTALNDVSLEIHEGESVAILGKSGSGKSTLMHLLATLDSPTEGKVFIRGNNVRSLSAKRLDKIRNQEFGFVFQQFFMNGQASVLENVVLPLKIAGISEKKRNTKAMEVLREVELEEKAGNKANDLSGGQKQRVVIARALINDPKVIFADEPTGNLDTVTGAKIEEILFRLNKERKITLVIVTHDEELARRCGRRIEIRDGEIVKEVTL